MNKKNLKLFFGIPLLQDACKGGKTQKKLSEISRELQAKHPVTALIGEMTGACLIHRRNVLLFNNLWQGAF
jgi:hypothetical protein